MRAVVDTNVLISAAIKLSSPPGQVLLAWVNGEFELITSESLLQELDKVIRRRNLMAILGWTDPDADLFLGSLRLMATTVEPQRGVDVVSRDPSDNRVLEAALAGQADYVVTGDQDLLDIGEYGGITIVTPAQFTALLRLAD